LTKYQIFHTPSVINTHCNQ